MKINYAIVVPEIEGEQVGKSVLINHGNMADLAFADDRLHFGAVGQKTVSHG
jgi:hypothetical protein